jgi:hypothetical protein
MNLSLGHGSRAVKGKNCLRSLGRCDRGFESHLRRRCLLCVYVFILCLGRGLALYLVVLSIVNR